MQTINTAIAHSSGRRYADARAAIGELDFDALTPFERSQAERVLCTVSYAGEDFEEAREHVRRSIAAGGLTRQEAFKARLALADIDVMFRLRETAFDGFGDESGD